MLIDKKKKLNGIFLILLAIFLIFFNSSFVISEEINFEEGALSCINTSEKIVFELNESNFSILRATDLLKKAQNTFYSQEILKEKGTNYNFSLVISICEEIELLRENAYSSRDSYLALIKFYDETFDEKIDTSSVDSIFSDIEKEISSERYERAFPLINAAYEEILKVKSENTALKLFYTSTTQTLGNFFKKNLYFFIGFFVFALIFFIFYRTAIIRYTIRRKIRRLEWRKESLKDLIRKVQKEYFEGGNVSESDYVIKTSNFAEMIRDIDREIPLLKEELVKVSKNSKGSKDKKEPDSFDLLGKKELGKRVNKKNEKEIDKILEKEEKEKESENLEKKEGESNSEETLEKMDEKSKKKAERIRKKVERIAKRRARREIKRAKRRERRNKRKQKKDKFKIRKKKSLDNKNKRVYKSK